jgi:hypothetical protein
MSITRIIIAAAAGITFPLAALIGPAAARADGPFTDPAGNGSSAAGQAFLNDLRANGMVSIGREMLAGNSSLTRWQAAVIIADSVTGFCPRYRSALPA